MEDTSEAGRASRLSTTTLLSFSILGFAKFGDTLTEPTAAIVSGTVLSAFPEAFNCKEISKNSIVKSLFISFFVAAKVIRKNHENLHRNVRLSCELNSGMRAELAFLVFTEYKIETDREKDSREYQFTGKQMRIDLASQKCQTSRDKQVCASLSEVMLDATDNTYHDQDHRPAHEPPRNNIDCP